MGLFQTGIIICFNGLGDKYGLIQINDAVMLFLELLKLSFDILPPLFIFYIFIRIVFFCELNLLTFDLIDLIDLTQ